MPLIEIDDVSHVYGDASGRVVLRDVSVTLDDHRIGIIGANGSGKSTFIRMLNGLVMPTHGTVRIDGLDTRTHAKDIRRQVGFCFTNPDNQIVMPTVREDVAFGLQRRRTPKPEIDRRVSELLDAFDLADHADHPAHLLSGGQKQLLALASILVTEPSLLVLDEPTTLLDLRNARQVHTVVDALPQQVVLVSHHLDLLDDFDRVLVFDEGRLVCDDAPQPAVAYYRQLMS